ncbi:hypothetical protein [Halalkalicoccus sp. NIPERK01]|uniref:hypothetical protein n=1 Tax=Halalkalicoccus sp. NIPERK01 TaxID=3053469 RepID=UPI00256F5C76|nr:hypothetical protein [Halalkalicoccus sp. NIPERK01]MDL5363349.1 hypothetical protein [Halalkalicoccus sp. NIPERK01]
MSSQSLDDPEESEIDREGVLSILEEAIYDVRNRTKEREVETLDDEQMLINWYRTLGILSGQYRMLQKDADIDAMEENIELLRVAADQGDRGGR